MRRILLLILITFFGITASAQTDYKEHIVIDNSFGSQTPNSAQAADIDNDGFMDIITTSTDELVWYKNLDGLGKYSKPKLIAITPCSELKVADVDGDGFLDVIFINRGLNSPTNSEYGIYWCKNTDGLGTFSAPVLIMSTSRTIGTLQVIDNDNDNDIDILFHSVDNYANSWLIFLINDGLGKFVTKSSFNNFLSFHAAADLNGDKLPDMIVRYTDQLKAFKQNSDGTYTLLEIMNNYSMETFFLSEDVDQDGDIDIAGLYRNGDAVDIIWYENTNGLGTFDDRKYLVDFRGFLGVFKSDQQARMLFKDFDSDGKNDILFNYDKDNRIIWLKNYGGGTFGTEKFIASSPSNYNNLFSADINKDGNNDVITTSNGNIIWYKNIDSIGTFDSGQNISTYVYSPSCTDTGDLDGDGDIDIVSGSYANRQIAWYKNTDGLGDFSSKQLIVSNTTSQPSRIFTNDIDNDGDLDIISNYYMDDIVDTSKILWFENDGKGNFIKEHTIVVDNVTERIGIVLTDVNNDGKTDIIATFNNKIVYLFKNIGNGVFADKQLIPYNGYYIYGFFVKDFDLDGDVDIFIVDYNKLYWYENTDGQGNYIQHIPNIPNSTIRDFFMSDVDGDNDVDIIYRDYKDSKKIAWFENLDGLGNFGLSKPIATNTVGNYNMSILDFDSDGDEDIICSFSGAKPFILYENLGAGKFAVAANGDNYYKGQKLVDINADGLMDFITSSFEDDKVAWIENLGSFGSLKIQNSSQTNVTCSSISSGSASIISVSGGTAPYSYLWSNGATTNTITELTAGNYSCTIIDADSSTITKSFTITTETDTEKPTITAPPTIKTNTTSNCTATGVVLGTPVTTDNCSVVSITNNAPTTFPIGTTTVTWTVKDGSGNTATATQIITVKDGTKPTITAPPTVTVNADSNGTASGIKLGTPLTADNCSVASVTNDAPTTFPLGNTTVTWTVKDASNNIATATQIVSVKEAISIPTPNFSASTTATNINESINFKDNSTNTPTSWIWEITRTGSTPLISTLQNPTFTFVDAGIYTVKLTATNSSGSNTKTVTDMITVVIPLPSNNFTIESKGETCLNENNGAINITAKANYNYVASINGTNYTLTNNTLTVANLAPATYAIRITIPGQYFEQNFSIMIPKAATIEGKSTISSRLASVEITEGTAPYTVFVNGKEQFETTSDTFSVTVNNGDFLEVKTAKACEGIYLKEIADAQASIVAHPNPTKGEFTIEVPVSLKNINIDLFTADSKIISSETKSVTNGQIKFNIENQPAGVYYVKIYLNTPKYLKIIKK